MTIDKKNFMSFETNYGCSRDERGEKTYMAYCLNNTLMPSIVDSCVRFFQMYTQLRNTNKSLTIRINDSCSYS